MLSTYASRSILRHRYVVFQRCAGLPCSFIALFVSTVASLSSVYFLFAPARRCTLAILPVNWASVMLCIVSSIRFGSMVLLRFFEGFTHSHACVDFGYLGCMRDVNLVSLLYPTGVWYINMFYVYMYVYSIYVSISECLWCLSV